MYMWNVLTAIFIGQVLMVIAYCGALATLPDYWWTCTLLFGIPFSYIAIQQILGRGLEHVFTFHFSIHIWDRLSQVANTFGDG